MVYSHRDKSYQAKFSTKWPSDPVHRSKSLFCNISWKMTLAMFLPLGYKFFYFALFKKIGRPGQMKQMRIINYITLFHYSGWIYCNCKGETWLQCGTGM